MNTNPQQQDLILPINQGNNHSPMASASGTTYASSYIEALANLNNINPVIKPFQPIPQT
jgi:hypothetical protein